jgi:hypothetical protein
MDQNTSKNVWELVAAKENTPELRVYWERRYRTLLESKKIVLSEKTVQLLYEHNITKPVTPVIDVVLLSHIKEHILDESDLQTTIESSVRLLDSLLDTLSLSEEARITIDGYRKVAIGVHDFEQYIIQLDIRHRNVEISHIGQFVSNTAYRASESLAEEKGVCSQWSEVQTHIRPKSFEYWYHTETGDIKDGLEMSEEFTQEEVSQSPYKIVPRRNVSLLYFPAELEWQIWSDRDIPVALPAIEKAPTVQPIESIAYVESNPLEAQIIEPETPIQPLPPLMHPEMLDIQLNEAVSAEHDSQFQVGELVKYIHGNKTGKIFQIIDTHFVDGHTEYSLIGSGKKAFTATDSDIITVELDEVLQLTATRQSITLVLVVEQNDTILVDAEGRLPAFSPELNEDPVAAIKTFVMREFASNTKDISPLSYAAHQQHITLAYKVDAFIHDYKNYTMAPLEQYLDLQLIKPLLLEKELTHFINKLTEVEDTIDTTPTHNTSPLLDENNTSMNIPINQAEPILQTQAEDPIDEIQYTLKLEHLIKTNTFGDILIGIQYDAQGARAVQAHGNNLQPEHQGILNSMLRLVNFMLLNDISPENISKELRTQPQAHKLPIDDLMRIIGLAMEKAPASVNDIKANTLRPYSQPRLNG